MNLEELRSSIDRVDDQILKLLNERAGYVQAVGKAKEKLGNNAPFYVPSRERAIFERLDQHNEGPFGDDAIHRIFREIISASLALEHPLKVVYLGPQATFTHQAATKQFGTSARLVPERSIPSVFEEVERGRAHYGVVPIENSNEGAVTHTLDRFVESDLKIVAELYLEISHNLLTRCNDIATVRRVYSHPQAIEQCRRWLDDNMGHAQIVEVSSTGRAAQIAAEEDGAAAIAGKSAGDLYDLIRLVPHIEDNANNFTRFLVIGRDSPPKTGRDRTSILFTFADQPGILGRMLEPFRKRNLNLAKIESRPVKKKAWEYLFYLDIVGHIEDEGVAAAIDELREFCHLIKHMGSFPSAR